MRVKTEKRVDRNQLLAERDLRMSDDRAGLLVECAAAIVTQFR